MKNFVNQKGIYLVELDGVGSEQTGLRPMIICSSCVCNQFSDIVVAVPLTTKNKTDLPVHHLIYQGKYPKLKSDSIVLCEQIRSIDKKRIGRFICHIDDYDFDKVIEKINANLSIYK